MTAIFVFWQGDHLRLCETWDGDSFRDFGIPKSASHETRLCRGHHFWRSEKFPAWKLSCEQQVFFWTQKQYLGLHHFKIDFRDVCALLDFASLEKLFSNPISLIQELEICERKCPEPWWSRLFGADPAIGKSQNLENRCPDWGSKGQLATMAGSIVFGEACKGPQRKDVAEGGIPQKYIHHILEPNLNLTWQY